ncbi:hypothetical protein [Niallia circulans]|uniref:hypothetical protein n=1 Tax=Niallia circulans TaxID=1397 RepID=UPI003008AAD6
MSFNGSEKEFLLTVWLSQHKIILEKELDLTLENVQLEKHYPGMKIDMYACDYHLGTEVFVESLLLKSNKTHQNKVMKIINMISGGIIIYLALDFHQKHIEELKQAIQSSRKPISLYFLKLNPNIFESLQKLNHMHKLKIYESFDSVNIENPIEFLKRESLIQPIATKRLERKVGCFNLETRKGKNEFLLETLRKRISYYLPFQRGKANLEKLRVISFGAGRSDCNYYVSLGDRRGVAFVELRFSENNSKIFDAIKGKKSVVQERFDDAVIFDDNCITVEFKPFEKVEDTVNKLTDIFEKMIIAFSNYTYYFYQDKKEMWQYHKQGI